MLIVFSTFYTRKEFSYLHNSGDKKWQKMEMKFSIS